MKYKKDWIKGKQKYNQHKILTINKEYMIKASFINKKEIQLNLLIQSYLASNIN